MNSTTIGVGDSFIFSTPTAITMSASPLAITRYAVLATAEPVAQAASTLIPIFGTKPQYSPHDHGWQSLGRPASYVPNHEPLDVLRPKPGVV
jgi:hypothetical protein